MADVKITALTVLTAADPINDAIPIVDVSNPSMAASGTTSRISINNLLSSSPTATGALTVTGLVTAGSATITGAATVGTTLGVTGVSTLASAVVTGALTVDTTTLVVNPSGYADRVGINTATPGYPLEVVGNAFFNADATCKRFFVNDTTGTGNAYINSADGSTSNIFFGGQTNYNYGAIIYDDASDFLAFRANGVEAARFNSTGNLVFPTGKGIDFSAVTGGTGTATANVLNDYEEGTFTPTFTASAGTPTTVTLNTAFYTKIGRRVSIDLDFVITNVGTASSQLRFTLPFNQKDPAGPCGVFKEVQVTGYAGTFSFVDDTRVGVNFYDNSTVWVNTYRLRGTYTYNV